MTTLENSRQSDWLQTELQSMSSRGASLARTSALQESRRESVKERAADYGQRLPDLLARYDHDTQLWRTSQLSLVETAGDGLAEFSETWPRSGMTRSGAAYRLPSLARTITEIGSGYWPTPTTKANHLSPSMMKYKGCRELASRYLPTPNAGSSHWGGSWMECGGSKNWLRNVDFGLMKIHPLEWEWMMGYPEGWTDLDASETQ